MRDHQTLKNNMQQGRTVTEVLGVLMIIGVLIIIGLQGFRYAVFRNHVNQTLNQISAAVAGARTTNLNNLALRLTSDENGIIHLPVHHIISDVEFTDDPLYFRTPLNADVGIYRDSQGIWRVSVKFTKLMSMRDCKALLTSSVTEFGIGYNGHIYTQKSLINDPNLLTSICRYYTEEEE